MNQPVLSLEQAFRQAVVETPDDIGPRLIYADWLEEQGREEEAGWVRERLLAEELFTRSRAYYRRLAWIGASLSGVLPRSRRLDLLNAREFAEGQTLTGWLGDEWLAGIPDVLVVVRYGFVTEIACRQCWFWKHVRALFQMQPVQDVRLLDLEPWSYEDPEWGSGSCWLEITKMTTTGSVHPLLFRHLQGGKPGPPVFQGLPEYIPSRLYPGAMEAYRDLSQACVAFGREQARTVAR